ncbi:hypothetical protein GCM10027430_08690 [Lysobacter tyrosinilyticus]
MAGEITGMKQALDHWQSIGAQQRHDVLAIATAIAKDQHASFEQAESSGRLGLQCITSVFGFAQSHEEVPVRGAGHKLEIVVTASGLFSAGH